MTPAQYFGLLAALGSAPGIMLPYAGTVLPPGFLIADGVAVSRTSYAALFAVIGTTYGIGDGATTFNLPDMQSRLPIGVGAGAGLSAYAVGDKGGAETAAIGTANLPNLALNVAVDTENPANGGSASIQGSASNNFPGSVAGAATSTSANTPLSILPPYLALNWLIKT